MFKVNFKPLWPEAVSALALLAGRFPDEVWQICSRQLLTAATRDSGLFVSRKPDWADAATVRPPTLVFEEEQLRCHHLEELRQSVTGQMRLFEAGVEAARARDAVLLEVSHFFFRALVST